MTVKHKRTQAQPIKAEPTVTCRVMRDQWDQDGKRHSKGRVVDLPVSAAMDGIENGTLERVKS